MCKVIHSTKYFRQRERLHGAILVRMLRSPVRESAIALITGIALGYSLREVIRLLRRKQARCMTDQPGSSLTQSAPLLDLLPTELRRLSGEDVSIVEHALQLSAACTTLAGIPGDVALNVHAAPGKPQQS